MEHDESNVTDNKASDMLSQMPHHLLQLVAESETAFAYFDENLWATPLGKGRWTRLQVLGHLIDSAANNHQRFVRALIQPRLDWPGYDQAAHVSTQNYAGADPAVCVALFCAYNRLISHVIGQTSEIKASTPCSIGGAQEMTLSDLILDYVAHLEHHLRQVLEKHPVEYSGMPWPPSDPGRQWPV